MHDEPQVYLASRSPRRQQLLQQIGVRYGVIPIEIDESPLLGESPEDYALRLALDKARAGRALVGHQRIPVLGADTAVVLDQRILGKPKDRQGAFCLLRQLSGRIHRVLSAVALVGEEESAALSISEVSFREIGDAEIQAYWETGEPVDKAGGYGIQGKGALFIRELRGSYSGVMGLPLYETGQLLAEEGVRWFSGKPVETILLQGQLPGMAE